MAQVPVLIIDDNEMNQQLLAYLLAAAGFEVHLAGDAAQALTLMQDLRPRLILMDLQLPGMGGLELTRRIKADPAHRDATIVAVTAYAMKGDEQKALEAGCDGYVAKPIQTASFVRTVTGFMAAKGPPAGAAAAGRAGPPAAAGR